MRRKSKWMALAAIMISASMIFGACGAKEEAPAPAAAASAASEAEEEAEEAASSAEEAAEEAASSAEEAASEVAEEATSEAAEATGAVDLNSMSLDDIIAQAKTEGDVQSVGMPDEWADWGSLWNNITSNYGLTHADVDMSSAEELQMFASEGEKGTKDIGDVGMGFTMQVIDEDLTQGYKTSYWDEIPDYAKGEDGKWIIAYYGATTFLVNNDQIDDPAPTSWADVKNGSYKISIGDPSGATFVGSFLASNAAFGGDLDNLEPGFEFWTEMAEAGRINTVDIVKANFESGEVAVGTIWSFTAPGYAEDLKANQGYDMEYHVPSDGAALQGYASVINKYAPHPAAAALTREVMLSDEGQAYLAGAGAIPTRTLTGLEIEGFDSSQYASALGYSPEEVASAQETIMERWNEEILPLIAG